LLGEYTGIIPVQFVQTPISGLEEVVRSFGQNPMSGFRGDIEVNIVDARTHGRLTTDNRQSQLMCQDSQDVILA